ncbi:HAD-IA family hydrolase [Amycolatopsis eburnea]|uniref:HAD family hydrolase n=1 Tax=Amycolatopsis eburnea TaxID=2267691 RepID=A0A427T0G6_9PSEU|nr:HAD-IA family hydrolase [Amycolatopsis eburnea]RSD10759.1 HAD family hydrolase [Amycolatopsis eburnea]
MSTPADALSCAAVLFDLDGVLVESGSTVERSWRAWAVDHGLDADAVVAACHGRPSAETIAAVAPHLDAAGEAAALELLQAADTSELVACPGAAEILAALPGTRHAVVTSGTRPLATARLTSVGLPVPAVLIAAGEVPRGKPAPDGYLTAAARLGFAPQTCVVVEDARPGVLAARAAGCRVIGIDGPALGDPSDVDILVPDLAAVAATVGAGSIALTRRSETHV